MNGKITNNGELYLRRFIGDGDSDNGFRYAVCPMRQYDIDNSAYPCTVECALFGEPEEVLDDQYGRVTKLDLCHGRSLIFPPGCFVDERLQCTLKN
mgnify:CR=1 FL=1